MFDAEAKTTLMQTDAVMQMQVSLDNTYIYMYMRQ